MTIPLSRPSRLASLFCAALASCGGHSAQSGVFAEGGSGGSSGQAPSAGGAAGDMGLGGGGVGGGGAAGIGGGGAASEAGNANGLGGGGASAGAPAGGESASAGSGGMVGQPTGMSHGCGVPLAPNVTTGVWVDMADELTNSPPAVQVPGANPGDPPIPRGYWIYVPTGYDPNVPHRVIYTGTGWNDTSAMHGGGSPYAFQTVDGADPVQTIQVGLEYSDHDPGTTDPNHSTPGYDEWVKSSDLRFFPILHHLIEDQLCVDLHRQFIAGFETGGYLANELGCAFPDVLRGVVEASGIAPRELPPCLAGHPTAGLFVHDLANQYESYASILPACTELLQQNGCTVKSCEPSNPTSTTPYAPGHLSGYGPSSMLHCVSFLGCPPDSPVVFCSTAQNTAMQAAYIGESPWVTSLLWNFIAQF